MLKAWTSLATLAFIVTMAGPAAAAGQTPATKDDTYTWNGELVSVDTTAKTMAVKSRVAYQDALAELKNFKAGDRVWIFWSGVHDYSDAVREIRRPGTGKIEEDLMMPAELVSTDAPNQYVTIRVKVPDSALSTLAAAKPGEWITITSRHRPSTEDQAVVAVRPYGSASNTE
jgi:hypothetical protein